MPVTEFEQPARRIGGPGGRGRGRVGLVVWALGLAGIVAVAVLGRPADDRRAPDAVADASPGRPGVSPPVAAADALVLTEPAAADEIATVALRVRGHADDVIRQVELVLLRADSPIARQTVRPTGRGVFGGVFTLGAPRSAGPLTVLAIGLDADGYALVMVRRPVLLRALAAAVVDAPVAVAPTARPTLGEDGLMGALALDLPAVAPAAMRWSWPVGQLGWQTNPAQR